MRIKVDLELCKKCQRCCRGTPGNMMAVRTDRGIIKINSRGKCEHLSIHDVCSIVRPLDCALYPIVILEDGIYIDKSGPGWQHALNQFREYAEQFKNNEIFPQGTYEVIAKWQI